MTARADLPGRVKKAARLINEHRLHKVEGDIWVTRGDTGTYLTVIAPEARTGTGLTPPTRSCTCEAGRLGRKTCSHVLAAEALLESEKHIDPIGDIQRAMGIG